MILSGIVSGYDVQPSHIVIKFSGELRLGTMPDVRRVLTKLFANHGNLLADLSCLQLRWIPAVHIFSSTLSEAGGWPAFRLVLFGADAEMLAGLEGSRVTRSVPVVADLHTAELRLSRPPDRVGRDLALPVTPAAPRMARSFLWDACTDWEVPELFADAALVVTELIINAIEHAGGATQVRVGLDERGLWLEVRDHRPGGEEVRLRPRMLGPGGRNRGLHIVAAVTSNWGVSGHDDGKTVWALVARR